VLIFAQNWPGVFIENWPGQGICPACCGAGSSGCF